jgi:hypothetical protein
MAANAFPNKTRHSENEGAMDHQHCDVHKRSSERLIHVTGLVGVTRYSIERSAIYFVSYDCLVIVIGNNLTFVQSI